MSKKRENPELSAEADVSETIGDVSSNDEVDAKKAKMDGENESTSIETGTQLVKGNSPIKESPSFNRLPEELVAQMATHLDYEEVWNLMESSKRNYKIVFCNILTERYLVI